jgi:protein-tyrosine kinase
MSGKDDDAWKRERNLNILNALRGITDPVATERFNMQDAARVKDKVQEPARVKDKAQEPARETSQEILREKVQELFIEKVQEKARNRGDFSQRSQESARESFRKKPWDKVHGTSSVKVEDITATKILDTSATKTLDISSTKVLDTPAPLTETVPGNFVSVPHSDRISRMREPRLLSVDDLEQKRIIHPSHPHRKVIERFRDLRTNLLQISKGKNFTLVVSSAVNNGGASFVAINLAAAFAFDSSKTALLVDCNLRYPTLHHAFDMIPDLGVTDFLDDPIMDVGSIIYPTGIKRLRFIPAGKRKEATADYFTSYRMKQVMSSVRERYPDRFIFLDTPSINEFPDAGILAELADYTLIVAPHAKVTEGKVVEACARVAKDKLLGVVINN